MLVRSANWSPNGQRIVTTVRDNNNALVWNIETGHQIIVLNGHDATVYSAAYSPDGQRIVTSRYDGTSKVWNAQTGQGALTLIGHYDGRISRI